MGEGASDGIVEVRRAIAHRFIVSSPLIPVHPVVLLARLPQPRWWLQSVDRPKAGKGVGVVVLEPVSKARPDQWRRRCP